MTASINVEDVLKNLTNIEKVSLLSGQFLSPLPIAHD
jgi:hypothetical protein